MRKWFVQYNPKIYDLIAAAKDPDLKFRDIWATKGETRLKANAHKLKERDFCLFVESGEKRGIIGYGIVKKSAHTRKITEEFSKHFLIEKEQTNWAPNTVREVIEISYERIFQQRIPLTDLKEASDYRDDFLGHLVRMPRGTFYEVPTNGWQFLQKIFSKKLDIPIENIEDFVEELEHLNTLSELIEPKLTEESNIMTTESIQRVRDFTFSRKIKEIYNFQCTICRRRRFSKTKQPEVEAAHIFPKSMNGSDDLRNGISLCKLHHWAFDSGLIAISNEYRILVREEIKQDENYKEIHEYENKFILFPTPENFKPHQIFLQAHREQIFRD